MKIFLSIKEWDEKYYPGWVILTTNYFSVSYNETHMDCFRERNPTYNFEKTHERFVKWFCK